jgi:HEAT repeat protein
MPDSVIELVPTKVDAVEELMPALRNPAPKQRLKALKIIVRHCPAGVACFDSLIKLIHDPDQNIRELAVQGLSSYGTFAFDTLLGCLNHHCKYVRRQAVWGLGKLELAALPAVRELCERLKDPDSRTAGGAAQALGAIGRDAGDAVPALAEAMRGTNVVLCRLASKALSQIGAPAIPTLITHLNHHDPFVRGETAFALGWIGEPASQAIPGLTATLLTWSKKNLREAVPDTNSGIHERITPVAQTKQPDESEENSLILIIQALGRMGPVANDAVPVLHAMSSKGRGRLREAANQSLGLIESGRLIQ